MRLLSKVAKRDVPHAPSSCECLPSECSLTNIDGVKIETEDSPNRVKTMRAAPMSAEDRRQWIAVEAIPLFIEHGTSVTTKQLAEHLGIAEGTIFRAFSDKEMLVKAVVEAFFVQTHEKVTSDLSSPHTDLRGTLRTIIRTTREFSHGVFRMLALLDHDDAHQVIKHQDNRCFEDTVQQALMPYSDVFNLPADRLGALIKLVVVAASAPRLSNTVPLDDEEILDFILYGIIGRAADRTHPGSRANSHHRGSSRKDDRMTEQTGSDA